VADTYSEDGRLAVQSLLWIGDQSLRQLATLGMGASNPNSLKLIDQAERAYNRVINEFTDRPMDVAVARLGLAAIAEERGQFDQAKAIYEAVSGLEGAALLPMANLAKVKLENIDHYGEPVTFASPPPPPPPTTQPLNELIIPPAPTSAPTSEPAAAPAPTTQPANP